MKNLFSVLIILMVGCNNSEDKRLVPPQPIISEVQENIDGEKLFKANCGNCHKCDKDYTGPALQGSLERWGNNKKAMYGFIRNPAKSINENTYAKELFRKWKANGRMTAFSKFTDKELDAIMKACDYSHPPQK